MLRLLERYVVDDDGITGGDVISRERYVSSIRTHLGQLFSVRRGSVRSNVSLGLPDFVMDGAFVPSVVGELKNMLAQLIKDGEPRLLSPHVELWVSEAYHRVRISVTGRVSYPGSRGDETVLTGYWDDHGMFHVD